MKIQLKLLTVLFLLVLISCQEESVPLVGTSHDFVYKKLPKSWDEGVPLGNAMVGALVWEKEGKLRFSLDRADLWDLRPMENLNTPEWNFKWVKEQWEKDTYEEVQDRFDTPYNQLPAPTKIPGGALEFDMSEFGEVDSVQLFLQEAVCEVNWKDGKKLQTFVHADTPVGWFRFEGVGDGFIPKLVPPKYQDPSRQGEDFNSHTGQSLFGLGYKQGELIEKENGYTYTQEGWGGFIYQIHVSWKRSGSELVGTWSISSEFPDWEKTPEAVAVVAEEAGKGFDASFTEHQVWWNKFWNKSSVQLPESLLENQWYRELYKFGSAARKDAPPISLQAVWTADNGKIPPWKGDFHHDLNTQLSYWPAYSGNHLDLEEGFINWLLKYKDTFKDYTKSYFETDGLNVPGVTTLDGVAMGGWIQYSFGPTVAAWLGHHFYLRWQYTQDRDFLEQKAYPWIKEVAVFFDELSEKDENGQRKLPISSSPEIFNNSREAWFGEITNYDLSLIRWTFEKAAELALELDKNEEAEKWKQILGEWPDYAVHESEGLMFSKNQTYHESHRHFSHLMAIHPLGLIDWSNGAPDQEIIKNTIINLDEKGPGAWTGYSYSWEGNLKARAMDGEGAAQALRIFAEAFVLPNSFHVNGDQTGKGYSNYTYRPFTLEGNFAFASGIQEMLIQSHTGIVHLFPAIPDDWKEVSFSTLRTVGAFLVSTNMENGAVTEVEIIAKKGGQMKLLNPFVDGKFDTENANIKIEKDLIIIDMKAGEKIILK